MITTNCFILFLLFFIACDKNDDQNILPNNVAGLVGEWQLKETYISPGGVTKWQVVDKGFSYIFESEGSFKKTAFDKKIQQEGIYQLKEEELFLFFRLQEEKDTLGFTMELTKNTLTLSPSFPGICIEGCLYRFKRQ